MTYDPRTIAFGAEIIHPPVQLQTDVVQGVHDALFKQSGLGYQNFQVQNNGIHLSNPAQAPGQVSVATFLPDRIILREEFRACTFEDFATRVVNVVSLSHKTLNIQTSVAQQYFTRSLVNPKHHTDSRVFVSERMLHGGDGALGEFARPLHTVGLRLTFPQTEDEKNAMNLRIEPWPQDPRSMWIEVTGVFAQPLPSDSLPQLSDHLYATYRFLTGPTFEFVERFDTPSPSA